MSTEPSDDYMEPKGLLNNDGSYAFTHENVYNLLIYTWAGALLPVTLGDYQQSLQISNNVLKKLERVIKPLVLANENAQAHCKTFKDKTYPSIVTIADLVYNYAQTAGGTIEDSYYANILDLIKDLAKETDSMKKQELKEAIDGLVDMQVNVINDIHQKADMVVEDLRMFERQTKEDQSALEARSTAIKKELTMNQESLSKLEEQLEKQRKDVALQRQRATLDPKEIITAAFSPIGGLLLIPKVIELPQIIKHIEELDKLMSSVNGQVDEEKLIVASLNTINDSLRNVLKLIGPAIITIQAMLGVWRSIAGDLNILKDMVDNNIRNANTILAKITARKVVASWNTLAVTVDKYRKTAYITEVEKKSLGDLKKELAKKLSSA